MKVRIIVENNKQSFTQLKEYILLYSSFLIYSFITIFAKFAALEKSLTLKFFLYIALEIIFLGFYAIIWQQVLKKFSLVTAMSNKGIVVILGLFWSVILFQETVTIYNILGAVLIMIGIWVVSKND